ncbi:hypothetical protein QBC34DRAFT_498878 [Podospora aff. communis PSN243]|uniref:Uncharacterized protein n=1 Tax=Podospora aff. communis PSN243 TaxID=3040156 RepID=A0AAV9G8B9_9PEZI|nr:hypothetical protein QBC34DRAFT_498878 [Podospora aff. communis PSN243]
MSANLKQRTGLPMNAHITLNSTETALTSSATESMGPGFSELPANTSRRFRAQSPVDPRSPPAEGYTSPGDLSPAPDVSVMDIDVDNVKDWRLEQVYRTKTWPTDPGLLPPHSIGRYRIPPLKFTEVLVLDEDEDGLPGVDSYFTSSLACTYTSEHVQRAERQTGPARPPFYSEQRYSSPVDPEILKEKLNLLIKDHQQGIKETDQKRWVVRRGIYGYETEDYAAPHDAASRKRKRARPRDIDEEKGELRLRTRKVLGMVKITQRMVFTIYHDYDLETDVMSLRASHMRKREGVGLT